MRRPVTVAGIGLRGPGLPGWTASRAVLAGAMPYQPVALEKPAGVSLPATERRRATGVTRLALDAASEALGGLDPTQVTAVFASSGGEVEVIHGILEQLASADRRLSPTAFHNSVHNAAAGYWSIASGSHYPADSLCAFDDSFGAGLAEALLRCAEEERHVLLVAYDFPHRFPISEFRRLSAPFAVALLLDPLPENRGLALLEGRYQAGPPRPASLADAQLEALRLGNPAARSLPLLTAIAAGASAELSFSHGLGGALHLSVAGAAFRPRPTGSGTIAGAAA